jgi:hypothetical protein
LFHTLIFTHNNGRIHALGDGKNRTRLAQTAQNTQSLLVHAGCIVAEAFGLGKFTHIRRLLGAKRGSAVEITGAQRMQRAIDKRIITAHLDLANLTQNR